MFRLPGDIQDEGAADQAQQGGTLRSRQEIKSGQQYQRRSKESSYSETWEEQAEQRQLKQTRQSLPHFTSLDLLFYQNPSYEALPLLGVSSNENIISKIHFITRQLFK